MIYKYEYRPGYPFNKHMAEIATAGACEVYVVVECEVHGGNSKETLIRIRTDNAFQPMGITTSDTKPCNDTEVIHIRVNGEWEAEAIAIAFRFISDVLSKNPILLNTKDFNEHYE